MTLSSRMERWYKFMKKQFGALFLSLVMVIGCSSTALAAEVGIERISLNKSFTCYPDRVS